VINKVVLNNIRIANLTKGIIKEATIRTLKGIINRINVDHQVALNLKQGTLGFSERAEEG
jgi:hypothetical protein